MPVPTEHGRYADGASGPTVADRGHAPPRIGAAARASLELLQSLILRLRRARSARRRNGYRCAKWQGKPNFTNPHLWLRHKDFCDFASAVPRARLHPVHRDI